MSSVDPSFPPLLVGASAAHPPPPPIQQEPFDLPVIDFSSLDPGRLGDACRSPGLFRLANHGLPGHLSNRVQSEARRILELPFERKRSEIFEPLAYFWGTPAVSLGLKTLNWLEGLHVSLPAIRSADSAGLGCPPPFRALMDEYGTHMVRIARTLFNCIAVDLQLDPKLQDSCMDASNGIYRMYRYPRLSQSQVFLGMGAHTDSSVFSIIDEDDVGGLQVLHGDAWFLVMPMAGTLIVNIGDMLQAISNDEYRSVEHRVAANGAKERMSVCFFVFPKEDFIIRSSNYREFSYKEFKAQVQEDIKEIGDKVGLHRFKL